MHRTLHTAVSVVEARQTFVDLLLGHVDFMQVCVNIFTIG
jgi:hypothetical protein